MHCFAIVDLDIGDIQLQCGRDKAQVITKFQRKSPRDLAVGVVNK